MQIKKTLPFLSLILFMFFLCFDVYAQSEEEKTFLRMYFKEEELTVVSATRSLKSITQVAENITVITAEDIELMNAHTLADVLNTVNGIQMSIAGASPGSVSMPIIQGSDIRHVTVFIDGVSLNNLSDNITEVSVIPVQNIEKIEIIKGPASSSWGSALGGVINIITKSSGIEEKLKGTLSVSYGERKTGDFRAEAYGKGERFGYYLSGGILQTDGFRRNEDFSENNIYAKFIHDITKNTDITFSLLYNKGDREEGDFSSYDFLFYDDFENVASNISLNSSLSKEIYLNVSLRMARQSIHFFGDIISTGDLIDDRYYIDRKYGANAKLTWKHKNHNVVAGTDYDDGTATSNTYINGDLELRRWAVFVNDTIAFGKFSVTPGIRYDDTDTNGDFTSPSFGITYSLFDNTLLRAYIARGFSIPPLGYTSGDTMYYRHNPDLKPEKVWSYQAGIETGSLKYLWLKLSIFRHDVRDSMVNEILSDDPYMWTIVNREKIRRQGWEIEFKTIPLYNTTLFAGVIFIDTDNLSTGEEIKNVKYTSDIGLRYDDKKTLRALLKGRYVWWNTYQDAQGKYNSMIFDINLIKGLYKHNGQTLEAFLTCHNIFNGSQYWHVMYKNSESWIEGGLRYKF